MRCKSLKTKVLLLKLSTCINFFSKTLPLINWMQMVLWNSCKITSLSKNTLWSLCSQVTQLCTFVLFAISELAFLWKQTWHQENQEWYVTKASQGKGLVAIYHLLAQLGWTLLQHSMEWHLVHWWKKAAMTATCLFPSFLLNALWWWAAFLSLWMCITCV